MAPLKGAKGDVFGDEGTVGGSLDTLKDGDNVSSGLAKWWLEDRSSLAGSVESNLTHECMEKSSSLSESSSFPVDESGVSRRMPLDKEVANIEGDAAICAMIFGIRTISGSSSTKRTNEA